MAGYGDVTTIMAMLGPDEASSGFQAGLEARIEQMQVVVSSLVDEATGRTFGSVAAARQLRVPLYLYGSLLPLPVPARTITGIVYGFDDEAGIISGGTALEDADWTVGLRDSAGNILALRSPGVWSGYGDAVAITGTWADGDDDTTVPEEIVWAVNYITAERIKAEQASPAGFVGPDGTVTPIRNPWNDPQVKAVLDKYRVTQAVVL